MLPASSGDTTQLAEISPTLLQLTASTETTTAASEPEAEEKYLPQILLKSAL